MSAVLDDPVVVSLQRRLLQLDQQRLAIVKNDSLPFYKPHDKQSLFHEAGAFFKRRMVRAGNRFGKSTMGCAEDCSWLRGERPWYPEEHPARRGGIPQRPVKLLTVTTDWDKVDEIFTSQRGTKGKAWQFLPRDGFVKSVRRNHSGAIDMIECANGSMWRFDTVKSYMANPQGSESSDWDAIHVDEPCPQQMWKAMSRGLIDRDGSAWFTLTPLTEFWMNDMFFPGETRSGKAEDNVWAVNGSTYDNTYLTEEAIKTFEATLSPEERECRINGLPLHLAGLIYKDFDWSRHVLQKLPAGWKAFDRPPHNYSIYFAIDPHPQTPHAVLFCAVSPLGQRFYYDDLFQHCSIASLAEQVLTRTDGYNVVAGRVDPLAYVNDPITETNMAYEMALNGLAVEKATKALAQGILKVQDSLRQRDPQSVYFCPTARRTLWEIQRYSWDDKKENKPVDRDDHMMENLYRLELMEPSWHATTVSRPVPDLEISGTQLSLDELAFSEPVLK